MKDFAYVMTNDMLAIIIDGNSILYSKENKEYEEIRNLILRLDPNLKEDVLKIINRVSKDQILSSDLTEVGISIEENNICFEGEVLPKSLVNKVTDYINDDNKDTNIKKFFIKLKYNPDKYVRDQLYNFIKECDSSGGFMVDSEGYILAYKGVQYDYSDYHTGTFCNKVGTVNTMPRNEVDSDPSSPCSRGLHICAKSYLKSGWASRIMLVKVDPKDIVSVPIDCSFAKCRCCKYEVIKEVTNEF